MQQFTHAFPARRILGHSFFIALLLGFALYALVQWSAPSQISYAAGNGAPAQTSSLQQGILDRTNYYRLQNGCPALVFNSKLNTSAQGHSDDMASNDFFGHTGSNGSTPEQRMNAAGYQDWAWAENIAGGYASPESVVDLWFNETPPNDVHRKNILNCQLTETGVGYTYLANDPGTITYQYYWVQDFGQPKNDVSATPTPTPSACDAKPAAPTLVAPSANGQLNGGKGKLKWHVSTCATTYSVVVNNNSKKGTVAAQKDGLTSSKFKVKGLKKGTFYWSVQACNSAGCKTSEWRMLKVP